MVRKNGLKTLIFGYTFFVVGNELFFWYPKAKAYALKLVEEGDCFVTIHGSGLFRKSVCFWLKVTDPPMPPEVHRWQCDAEL